MSIETLYTYNEVIEAINGSCGDIIISGKRIEDLAEVEQLDKNCKYLLDFEPTYYDDPNAGTDVFVEVA